MPALVYVALGPVCMSRCSGKVVSLCSSFGCRQEAIGKSVHRETKVADVETALQRSPTKRPSVYMNIITEIISLLNSDKRYAWLQQEGETCHTSRERMEVLTEFFNNRVISEGLWPPRSANVNSGFFLSGYLKNVAFRNNPQTLDELKSNICENLPWVPPWTLRLN
ncbi:transposable element Tc3 transposase [Trichonephila clavipes]|nr:transposable element Tc3 transposase [Trichonephila clavipes]